MARIFRIGDLVRIRSGPLASFSGRITGINQSKSLLKVKVDIFWKAEDVSIAFDEAEKLKVDPKPPPYGSDN